MQVFPSLSRWAHAALGCAALLSSSAGARAQTPDGPLEMPPSQSGEALLWVPELRGAVLFALSGDQIRHAQGEEGLISAQHWALQLGYLHYLDAEARGRWAIGGGLEVGRSASLGSPAQPGRPGDTRLALELSGRRRWLNARFMHSSLSLWGQVGAAHIDDSRPDRSPPPTGEARWVGRAAVGLEMGAGLLWWLSPYLFGEGALRLGVESLWLDGQTQWGLLIGLRLPIEWALRSGAAGGAP